MCFDLAWSTSSPLEGHQHTFRVTSTAIARELAAYGIDARVGPLPGEYCPGAYSINGGGRVKLVGTAQRAVQGGGLLSGVVVVRHSEPLKGVLTDVYSALDMTWEPATVGALDEFAPLSIADTRAALVRALAPEFRGQVEPLDPATVALARQLSGP